MAGNSSYVEYVEIMSVLICMHVFYCSFEAPCMCEPAWLFRLVKFVIVAAA